ncbi:MAG TPA: PLP-dependent aminotransferase family protein [Thermoanaerobaculia bacterium]|nr:PLP-dependent aminotransferase family protein [Thermoanaerobaculia bacterium]
MTTRFARRMEALKASEIREILKVTQRPEVISFAGGLPAPELFPVRRLAAATQEVFEEEGTRALQYSTTEGHPPLRRKIAERMSASWGAQVTPEQVLVTSGSQQGLDLTGKLFLDEGDVVLCESPTYLGALSAWNVMRPRWVEVATDDDGMDPAALESKLRAHPNAKAIYVIPTFQNPSGRTWSLERRRRFMEVVERHDVWVVEDNPYGELRLEGESVPSLKSFDTKGRVVALGTFSKVFCPGLRIAWVAADLSVIEKLVILKQGADLQTATLSQLQVNRYLEENDLDADIAKIVPVYRERRDAMLSALEQEMPPGVRWTRPQGGLFLWMTLPANLNARTLLDECVRHNVAFVPGGAFFPNGGNENTLRLNYSNMPIERIREGVKRLAASVVREMERAGVLEEVPATP